MSMIARVFGQRIFMSMIVRVFGQRHVYEHDSASIWSEALS